MSIKAKTCPFCGISLENIPPSKVFYHVNNGCILSSENFSINDIEKWNTRKPMQEIVERLEEYQRNYTSGLGDFTDELVDRVLRNTIEVVKGVTDENN